MKAWMTKALELLKASLEPPKHELNELDWKAALSPDKKPEKQRSMVSVLIQEAIDKRLVKNADPQNKSRKFAEYVPFWA